MRKDTALRREVKKKHLSVLDALDKCPSELLGHAIYKLVVAMYLDETTGEWNMDKEVSGSDIVDLVNEVLAGNFNGHLPPFDNITEDRPCA